MSAPETFGDIYCKVVAMFPHAIIDEGDQGELVIHTNLFPVAGDGDCYEDRNATASSSSLDSAELRP